MQLLRYRKLLTQALSENLGKGLYFLLHTLNINICCLLYIAHTQGMFAEVFLTMSGTIFYFAIFQ